MATTYLALHQGHAYRTTRKREVAFAVFQHNEYSLLVDSLLGWTKTERGAREMGRGRCRGSSDYVIVPAKVEA
jgi:hypothetical protein